MRVTDGMRDSAMIAATTKSSSAVHLAAGAAQSGMRVRTAADDPAAFSRIVNADEHARRLGARVETLDRSAATAGLAESTLAQSSEILLRIKEIAVAMADGTATNENRTQAASAVAELRKALGGLANTRGAEGYLFAGSRTDAPPFDAAGSFAGDDVSLMIASDDGVQLRSNASGASAFTAAGGRDVFADIVALEARLASNDPDGVAALLDQLDGGHAQIVRERARVGLTQDRMQVSSAMAADARGWVQQARAEDAEVDAVTAYTQLAQAQSAYERTLEVSRRLLSALSVERMLP